ncbi:hypothetical protein FRX31_016226 [Thalictrum thalictroides]|uniref:Uncharacterized protein n=1 Tax=Thalictrum thalictroides TaxID=46969 RepID=A0A7J6WBD5_THATH|nr:hypothetical protein FRX31_016226 [Thalictrum thalictroides]
MCVVKLKHRIDVVPYEQQPEPLRCRRIATPTQRSERFRNTSSSQYSWLPDGWEAEERRRDNGVIDIVS